MIASVRTATTALLALVIGAAALQAPAAAQRATAVSVSSGVLYPGCHDVPWTYTIDPAQAAYDWAVFVSAYDPSGSEVSSDSVWKDEGAPPSGTGNGFQVCSHQLSGTWTLQAEVHFYGGPYADIVFPTQSFSMREAKSKTSVTIKKKTVKTGQTVKVKIRCLVEYPNGFYPESFVKVVAQRKVDGVWKKAGVAYVDDRGYATVAFTWKLKKGKQLVRGTTPRTDRFLGSQSSAVKVKTAKP
ncbi:MULTISPECIES: hypothetical protein [unclassified Nocardioides]|uniref:hypothetical protein n=1 Tax=unclassified Nocardioides TaxID=2615069 RepID=UPI0036175634